MIKQQDNLNATIFGELKIGDRFKFDYRGQFIHIKTQDKHPMHHDAGFAKYDLQCLRDIGFEPINIHEREWICFNDDQVFRV